MAWNSGFNRNRRKKGRKEREKETNFWEHPEEEQSRMQISRTQTANYPSNSPVSCFLNTKNSQKLNRKQNKTKKKERLWSFVHKKAQKKFGVFW